MSPRVVICALVLAGLGASSCSSLAVAAATVNGAKISEAQVEEEAGRLLKRPDFRDLLRQQGEGLRGEVRRSTLTGLIRQSVLIREATKRKIQVSAKDVTDLLTREATSRGQKLEQFLQAEGLTMADARVLGGRFVRELRLYDAVTIQVRAGDEEIQTFYDQNQSAFQQTHVLRMTLAEQQEAGDVLRQLNDGASFGRLARQLSSDDLASDGGDMGFVDASSLGPQVQAQVEAATDGGYVGPVQGQGGFEVYQVLERRPRPLEDVRDQIATQLVGQRRDAAFEEWMREILTGARIVVNPKYGRFDDERLQVVADSGALPE